MRRQIQLCLLFILTISFTLSGFAQESPDKNLGAEQIKGVRFLMYQNYTGFPFLNDTWDPGKIEFADGEIADSLYLRYSSFKDELVYFNKINSTQIVIDKASLSGFSFTDKYGHLRIFRKQYFDNYLKADRFFEVLSSGETDLLAFRKISLNTVSPYKDASGILKNMEYTQEYQFYFYSPEKGYTSVKPNWLGVLAKFDKKVQKPIKKLLRKNRLRITNEENFVQAWKLIEKEGYKVMF
jgi:hypothetical protein